MKIKCISVLALMMLAFTLSGCTAPDAISKFCGSAATTLSSAGPIFDDMKQSCLREVDSRNPFGTFVPPLQSDPNCTAIGNEAAGAKAAAEVLSSYFTAINSLASFGTAKVGTDASSLVSKTGAAVGEGSTAQAALGSIAQFLTSAALSGYQERQLEKDLPKASQNITNVTSALTVIVRDDYIARQLKSEEEKLAVRYKEYAKDNHEPEVQLILDNRWRADEASLEARRASAESLVSALGVLSKGFADLATNAHQLKAKEIPALLDPYVTQIQGLVPQIQKGF